MYKRLFAPIVLGDRRFRNRIFAAPVAHEYYATQNFHAGDDLIAIFERKAEGGAATVSIGSAAVDYGRGTVGPTVRLDDPTAIAAHYRLTQCVARHGAVMDIELQHCGINAYHSKLTLGNDIYGAVASTNGMGMEVPEMPEEVIVETIEKFGDAAQFAKHCGYGMVTVHAGHGWLLNQFLGPENNRKDQWGGSLANRSRIVRAIATNIKKKCGQGFPINVRMSGSEIFEGGYDIDYGIEIARQLDAYFDLINVSVGAHEAPTVFTNTHPSMFLEDGVNVTYAAAIKREMTHAKVATVGGIAEPELMEEIIASGKADVVMLGRQLMADPDTPVKAQMNLGPRIRKCLRCFECFSGHFTRLSSYCAINPEIGFEREIKYASPEAKIKKKILVAGGGVGGMQAAITAGERGHEVILYEKSNQLGGALRCESQVPFKQNLMKYLNQQAELIARLKINTRLNTEVTPALVDKVRPDVIIAAVGARPVVPNIKGIDSENVMSAETAYMNAEAVGDEVIILGGGLSGLELAIYLSGLGRHVSVMEMANQLNFSGNVVHSMAINNEISRYKIAILTSTRAVEINEQGVTGEYVGDTFSTAPTCETINKGVLQSVISVTKPDINVALGSRTAYLANTIIYALGQVPPHDEVDALRSSAPLFFELGDCVEPKNIYAATSTAYTIARDIGRY